MKEPINSYSYFPKFKDKSKPVRIFFAIFENNGKPGNERLFNDYIEFSSWVKTQEFNIEKIGYFEIEFSEIKKTFDAILNATVNTNISPNTTVSETIYFLYKFYTKLNNYNILRLYDDKGNFLWV